MLAAPSETSASLNSRWPRDSVESVNGDRRSLNVAALDSDKNAATFPATTHATAYMASKRSVIRDVRGGMIFWCFWRFPASQPLSSHIQQTYLFLPWRRLGTTSTLFEILASSLDWRRCLNSNIQPSSR